jgi:hypothetical protein
MATHHKQHSPSRDVISSHALCVPTGLYFLMVAFAFGGCSTDDGSGDRMNRLSDTRRPAPLLDRATSPGPGQPAQGPRIRLDSTAYNLGRIAPESTTSAAFTFSNIGNSTLRILDVRACCGAVISLPKKELAPGEFGLLKVEYGVGQTVGVLRKTLALFTNDPENSEVGLTITGEIIRTLVWTPARFEVAPYKKDVASREITIRSLDNVPFSITRFTATGQCLTVKADPGRKATEFILKPVVDMGKLNSLTTPNGNIRIELDHPDYRMIDVPFSVIPALQATPPQILVFNAKPGEPVTRPIHVQDNQADPNTGTALQVESVTCKNGGRVELRGLTAVKTGCEVKLEICPGAAKQGESFFTDELTIRMKDGRQMVVPLRVFYQVPALPAASPGS